MSEDTGLFFGQFPQTFDSLQAVLVSVRHDGPSSESLLEARQFYREIIFTEPELLIAPESEEYFSSNKACIIAQDHILQSPRLLSTLEKFSLEKTRYIPVTRNMFVHCFEFVVRHRMAPLWNKVGPYYIKGRDFLLEKEKLCAIIPTFSLTDKLTLGLKALMLRFPPPKIEEFGVSPNIMQQFRQSSNFSINGHSLEKNTCLVLPSMKTGYITCIARKTAAEDFDLKRYWKVMYGFRLPDSYNPQSEDLLYSVRFPTSDKTFLYPECCIRSKEAQVFLRCDHKATFLSFMEDLLSRLPSLCGSPLKFTSSTLYPTTTFYSASLSKQTNLTRSSTPSYSTQPFVFTAKKISQKEPEEETSEKRLEITSSQSSLEGKTSSVGIRQCDKTPYVPCFGIKHKLSGKGFKIVSMTNNERVVDMPAPIVPCFKRKSTCGSNRKKAKECREGVGSKATKTQTTPKKNQALCNNTSVTSGVGSSATNTLHMTTKQSQASRSSTSVTGGSSRAREYGKGVVSSATKTQTTPKKNPALCNSTSVTSSGVVSSATNTLTPKQNQASRSSTYVTGENGRETAEQVTGSNVEIHQQSKDINQVELEERRVFCQKECVIPGSKQRKTHDKKPKAEVNFDIRKLAMENKLSKVNAIAILKWLKTEGVKCKSREKKPELIRKVYEFLEIGQPDP